MKCFVAAILFITSVVAENQFISNYVFKWGENHPEAVVKYLEASIDNPVSAYILGTFYLTGTFVKQDLALADKYITLAAEKGLPEAINSIGDGYYTGDIREKDIGKALEYYEKAADLGYGPAQFNAGVVLLNRATCKADLKRAIKYLKLATQNDKDLHEITKSAQKYLEIAEERYEHT